MKTSTCVSGRDSRVTNSGRLLPLTVLTGLLVGLPLTAAATPVDVVVDVKPGQCPNLLNINSKGLLSVAVFGSATFSVLDIDLSSVRLSRVDGFGTLGDAIAPGATIGSVAPIASGSSFTVLQRPFSLEDEVGNCAEQVNDGVLNLVLQFRIDEVVQSLELQSLPGGAIVPLGVTGDLKSGGQFSSLGSPDFVTILLPSTPGIAILQGDNVIITAPDTNLFLTASVQGRPEQFSFQWCKQLGLGEVTFSNPDQQSTVANFDIAGEYLLTVTVSGKNGSSEATIRVTVNLNPTGDFQRDAIIDLIDITEPALQRNRFLTYGGFGGFFPNVTDEVTANAYYDTIDPLRRKTNLNDWLRENGMLDQLTVASYFNAVDLGLGRHMVMANSRRAFAVTNFRTADDAVNEVNPIATVTMEYSPATDPASGNPVGDPFTKFYVFGADGRRVNNADLDGGGPKFVPGLCIVCHGGINPPNVAQGQPYPNNGNVRGHFLPFDLTGFDYSCDPNFTRSAQEGAFKELNRGVVEIERTNPYPPNNPMTALIELIEGWYGGTTLPSPTQNTQFVPTKWTTPIDRSGLYQNVVARSCRTCHVTRQSIIDFDSFAEFNAFKLAVQLRVFGSNQINVATPIIIHDDEAGMRMPQVRKTFQRFWLSTSPPQPEILRDFLIAP